MEMKPMVSTSGCTMLLILVLGLMGTDAVRDMSRLTEVYSWKTVDYVFPNASVKEDLTTTGQFISYRTMPMGLEVWRNKLFISVPRRKSGVPVVLGYIDLQDSQKSPLIIPYPDYETNSFAKGQDKNEVHITTAYRIRADACDRLWIIDTGRADVGEGFGQLTTPKILIYNLHDDQLLFRYDFKASDYKADSFFANIAVDVTNSTCDDAFAYMPDLGAYGLVVFSLKDRDSWRVSHNFFHLDPLAGDFNVDGRNFQLSDGAFSVALSNIKGEGYRTLYFHSLVSYNEFSVSTKILRNKTIASKSYHQFKNLGQRGTNSQSSATFFDEKTGVLFFLEVQNHAVTCWDTSRTNTLSQNIDVVAADTQSRAFTYLSDVKVDRNHTLWILTNNIPGYIFGNLNPEVYNYFIFKAPVNTAIRGTKCDHNFQNSNPTQSYTDGTQIIFET